MQTFCKSILCFPDFYLFFSILYLINLHENLIQASDACSKKNVKFSGQFYKFNFRNFFVFSLKEIPIAKAEINMQWDALI